MATTAAAMSIFPPDEEPNVYAKEPGISASTAVITSADEYTTTGTTARRHVKVCSNVGRQLRRQQPTLCGTAFGG